MAVPFGKLPAETAADLEAEAVVTDADIAKAKAAVAGLTVSPKVVRGGKVVPLPPRIVGDILGAKNDETGN